MYANAMTDFLKHPPNMCYHAQFGRSLKSVVIDREPPKLKSAVPSAPLERDVADL